MFKKKYFIISMIIFLFTLNAQEDYERKIILVEGRDDIQLLSPLKQESTRLHRCFETINDLIMEPHFGIDIYCLNLMDVYSMAAGEVLSVGYDEDDLGKIGQYVVISHHSGIIIIYGHLSKLLCEVGDVVSIDTIIGKAGNSGHTNSPCLHIGIKYNDIYLEPIFAEE